MNAQNDGTRQGRGIPTRPGSFGGYITTRELLFRPTYQAIKDSLLIRRCYLYIVKTLYRILRDQNIFCVIDIMFIIERVLKKNKMLLIQKLYIHIFYYIHIYYLYYYYFNISQVFLLFKIF